LPVDICGAVVITASRSSSHYCAGEQRGRSEAKPVLQTTNKATDGIDLNSLRAAQLLLA